MGPLGEIAEYIVEQIAKFLGGTKSDKERTQYKQMADRDTMVSEADMVKRLKILMSIPVTSPKYSEKLDDFLKQIWDEKVSAFETEGRRNEFTLYKGRLDMLKQYANEKNGVRLKIVLEEMLSNLEKDRESTKSAGC